MNGTAIQRRRAKNARNSLCRLPPELLVRIVLFVQDRRVFWHTQVEDGAPLLLHNRDWMSVMLVCTHLRAVTIGAPELWACVNPQRWKDTWVRLVMQRAGSYPLQVIMQTKFRMSENFFKGCEKQIELAIVDHNGYFPGSINGYAQLLATHSHSLRSLMIYRSCNWSGDQPIPLAHFAHMTCLSLCSVTVIGTFDFPKSLKWLRLTNVAMSSSIKHLLQQFSRMPYLEHFEVERGRSLAMSEASSPSPPSSNQQPHHLHSLILRECSIDLIYPLLQVLPPPNRILHTECDFEELDPSQPEHGAAVRSYVYQYSCRFWERASSSGFLPPVTLYLDRDLRFQRLVVKTKEAYSISSSLVITPIMYVSMRYLHTQEDNKLLSRVSHLRVSAHNETFLFLDAETWPALPHIPPLETAWFQISEPFKAIKKIQAWVDGCACRPVRVDIVSYISEDWNVLTWTPMQGHSQMLTRNRSCGSRRH
jgi:hypothetical protein